MSIWLILVLFVYFVFCVLLMGVILIQSGKGGGLSSLGSAAGGISDALGATGLEKTLNKITTIIAGGFMVLAILLSVFGSRVSNRGAEDVFGKTPPPAAPGSAVPAIPSSPTPINAPPVNSIPQQKAPIDIPVGTQPPSGQPPAVPPSQPPAQ